MEIDIASKSLAFLYSFLILGNAFFIKKYVGTFLFPASIFSLFWFAYTFFPLVFVSLPIEPLSIFFILLSTTIFTLSSLFFNWEKAFFTNMIKSTMKEKLTLYDNKFLRKIFYTMQLLVILLLIINLYIQGFSLYDIIFDTLHSANRYMSMRYAHLIIPNTFNQLALIFNYSGVILGGILLLYSKSTKTAIIILILSFFPSIMIMVTQAAKGYIFLSAVLFYSGILISRINIGDISLSNKKTNKIFLYLILLMFPVLIFSFLSRGLYSDSSDVIVDKLIYYFSSYAFGHLYAFSDWFSYLIHGNALLEYEPTSSPYYGFYTFMSFFKLFGSDISVPPGVYNDYLIYDNIIKTNIYTIYRGLILDFGLWGALVFWFIVGFLSHLCFYIILIAKKPIISVAIFPIMLGFMYMSYIISLFMWNSIFASAVVLIFILYINKYKLVLNEKEIYS